MKNNHFIEISKNTNGEMLVNLNFQQFNTRHILFQKKVNVLTRSKTSFIMTYKFEK